MTLLMLNFNRKMIDSKQSKNEDNPLLGSAPSAGPAHAACDVDNAVGGGVNPKVAHDLICV